jgi:phage FluMu gp28-like protein
MDSAIYGMSQDSDALRQYTATSVFWDEMAFHEHAYAAYGAVKPTLMGGGRLCGVSTPNGKNNLFYDLVHNVKK